MSITNQELIERKGTNIAIEFLYKTIRTLNYKSTQEWLTSAEQNLLTEAQKILNQIEKFGPYEIRIKK